MEWVAWGVVDGSWSASGPRDHCEAASAAASRLPPAAMPPIASRLPPVPLDTACDLLGLPNRPPPRLCACVPIADRRPPTADRRAPPAASDLPARRPACVPACLPAARRRGRWWSLRGLCWVPRMEGGDDGGLGWCARRRPRVWWGGCRARGQQRCERYGAGVGLRWLGRAPTAFSLRTAFGAPFSHRVFAFRCCLCFRHSYLTHPRPRGMRINALKATVLASLTCL